MFLPPNGMVFLFQRDTSKMTTLKEYINQQGLNNIIYMLTESFEVNTSRKLSQDEIEYLANITKFVFEEYSVVYEKTPINVMSAEDKEKLDKLIDKFVKGLTKLMMHHIFSRMETFILLKEVKKLRENIPPQL